MQKLELKYELIVSDFDGTLISHDGTCATGTKETIDKYRANGGIFAISTGRLPAAIVEHAKGLGLSGVVCCCQGAVIVDIDTKEVLYHNYIPNAIAIKICEELEKLNVHIHVYDVWEFYSNMDDEHLKHYEKLTGTKAKVVTDKPLSKILRETGMNACKFLAMVEPERNAEVRAALEKCNFEGCNITKSAEYLVEVISDKTSKGTALSFLAEYYGISMEKTLAVGDQWNDIPMIERAGLGAAVKNGDEKLKEAADIVLEYTNEEGAVAKLIEKYGLSEE